MSLTKNPLFKCLRSVKKAGQKRFLPQSLENISLLWSALMSGVVKQNRIKIKQNYTRLITQQE